jgi:sugar/nucleoside kinase (ribokinase family)
MAAKVCCIGHITLDKIITPRHTAYMPGGTSYYFAHAFSHLDPSSLKLVTALAQSEVAAVEEIRAKGIEVKLLPSRHSVYFENKYGENSDNRTQRVLAKADPFRVADLEDVVAQYYHLGTLLSDDFSLDVIKYLSGKGVLSVDAQGYLREVRGENVYAVDWADKVEALKYIDILKVNEHEMEVLTGCTDPREAAVSLARSGVKEVLLTLGSMGSLIYAEGKFYEIPAYAPRDVVDATGCGDTYMAGYLYKKSQGSTFYEAGCYAAAMCTLKLEASGPFSASEEEIMEVVRR